MYNSVNGSMMIHYVTAHLSVGLPKSFGLWLKYVITGLMMVMLYEMAAGQGNRFVKWSVGGTMLFVAAIRLDVSLHN